MFVHSGRVLILSGVHVLLVVGTAAAGSTRASDAKNVNNMIERSVSLDWLTNELWRYPVFCSSRLVDVYKLTRGESRESLILI